MLDLRGRALLGRVVDRLKLASQVSKIVVATSDQSDDQAIAEFCAREGIHCARGSLDDVATRFRRVVEDEAAPAFVRISGDSPLIDPALVDRAIQSFLLGDCDLATNVQSRTFPRGQSVEVLLVETFVGACDAMTTASQREHVTRIYYEHPQDYRIRNFTSGLELGGINLSVDTPKDLAVIEAILERSGDAPGTWRDTSAAYEAVVTT